jgi:hypothetical protein
MTRLPLILALSTAIMVACGGPIRSDKDTADEDALDAVDDLIDMAEEVAPDVPEDSEFDTTTDPEPDTAEDSEFDTTTDPEPDTAEDDISDGTTDAPELPEGCVLPTIPDTGFWIYYCMEMDDTTRMFFYREVDLPTAPDIENSGYVPCHVTTFSRDLLCNMADYDPATWTTGTVVKFNINTFDLTTHWSCAPWTPSDPWAGVTNGAPVAKLNGVWLTFDDPTPDASRCWHTLTFL